MKKFKVGIAYSRVSTEGQVQDDQGRRKEDASPEAQKERCEKHVEYMSSQSPIKWKIVEFLCDEGYSGKNTDRPHYQRMWDLIANRQIDFVIASELSRLSRSVLDFLEFIAHCEKNNVDVIIIGLKLDTTEAFGRMLIIILVALAQFEREMTSHRVRENALARLLKDGKINGAAEILGLSRDKDRRGHFLVNNEELIKAEKILRFFVQFSSKTKVLAAAKKMGITGQGGRALTARMVDTVIENAKWRYRGVWRVNEENQSKDQSQLPPAKQFQLVPLPHGPLLDKKLLDEVENKLADTKAKHKKSGTNDYIYLLTNVLYYEDGTKFSGQCAKNREYRYYHNRENDLRIRCDDIHPRIIGRVKTYLRDNVEFPKLVEDAVTRRQSELPKVEAQIASAKKDLRQIEESEKDLRTQLLDPSQRAKPGFISWLSEQVENLKGDCERHRNELLRLERYREEVLRRVGLEDLEETVKTFKNRFSGMTGTEQRNLIEKIVKRIVVHKDNRLELIIFGRPPQRASQGVTGRNKSTDWDRNGGVDGTRTRGLPRDRRTL